jgi:hypothetical protein
MDRCISKKEEELLYPRLEKNIIKTKKLMKELMDGRSNRLEPQFKPWNFLQQC